MVNASLKVNDKAALSPQGEISWKAVRLMAYYRLLLSSILLVGFLTQSAGVLLGHDNPADFIVTISAYLIFALYGVLSNSLR